MTRRADWSQRLYEQVEQANALRFHYGLHDCCLWAAHCVDVMCDTDHARQIKERFQYDDEASAGAIIASGGGLALLVDSFLPARKPPTFAAPGDVVVARDTTEDEREVVGVVVGHTVVVPGLRGLTVLPYHRITHCWEV